MFSIRLIFGLKENNCKDYFLENILSRNLQDGIIMGVFAIEIEKSNYFFFVKLRQKKNSLIKLKELEF